MKKMMKALIAGLMATGCLIAYGETETVSGQGCMTNQLIRFNHIVADEAATTAMGFKGTNGKFIVLERINAIHVTDSQENINRMREIFRELDVPSPVLEEVFDRQIKYAKATDIKTHLEKIVTESQKENQKEGGASNTVITTASSDVARSIIRGKVLIVADAPSNKLVIISQKENMEFFDKVINSLDVETTPEKSVERKLR